MSEGVNTFPCGRCTTMVLSLKKGRSGKKETSMDEFLSPISGEPRVMVT